jgi:hypothetical protein
MVSVVLRVLSLDVIMATHFVKTLPAMDRRRGLAQDPRVRKYLTDYNLVQSMRVSAQQASSDTTCAAPGLHQNSVAARCVGRHKRALLVQS